jgi:hypothetical protein
VAVARDLSPYRRVSGAIRLPIPNFVSTQTEHMEDVPMQLLADHLSISLLWDLADPAGPDSADLLAHEV